MRILVFGTGLYYRNRRDKITKGEIIGFLDNNSDLWGQEIDGVSIYAPEELSNIDFDIILLMSKKSGEMYKQLISELSVNSKRIYTFSQYIDMISAVKLEFIFADSYWKDNLKKHITIIATDLWHNGGTMAVIYAAKSFVSDGYRVTIVSKSADSNILEILFNWNINVVLCKSINCLQLDRISFFDDVELFFVNTLSMYKQAIALSKLRKTIWWIHESPVAYEEFVEQGIFDGLVKNKNLYIYAVSDVARNTFERYSRLKADGILNYGIPDVPSKKMVFAILGGVMEFKGHDIFIEAINIINREYKKQVEFLIIGQYDENGYGKEILEAANKISNVKMLGKLTREEVDKIYEKIDVVVNPSRQDSLPVVITEGLMNGKICITSEVTGSAAYITHKYNGLVCKNDDPSNLAECMKWIINADKNELNAIKTHARETYEKFFSLKVFERNFESVLRVCGVENKR